MSYSTFLYHADTMDYRFILHKHLERIKPEIAAMRKITNRKQFRSYISNLKEEVFINEMNDYGYHFFDRFRDKLYYEISVGVDRIVSEVIIL